MADQSPDGEQDIWTRHKVRQEQTPPNLDEILIKFKNRFLGKRRVPPRRPSGGGATTEGGGSVLVGLLIVAVLAIWGLSGIYTVKPAERSVILRFGAYSRDVGPGLHWIPRLFESQYTLDVQRIAAYAYEAEMLTQDENIVDVSLSVQFRIADPNQFLFSVEDPVNSLQQATASALRQVVGQTTLDDVLTTGRAALRSAVERQLMTTLARYKTGLEVTDVNLLPAKPPEQVTEAFDDAINAREDEQRYINQAEAYAQKVVPIARGQAARILKEAGAYQKQVILHAKADVARFKALLDAHKLWPVVTESRLYFDALQDVLGHVQKVFVDVKGSNPLLYLPIERWLKRSQSSHPHLAAAENGTDDVASMGTHSVRPDYSSAGE